MTGAEVRQVFETRWPQEELDRLGQPCGVIERQRTLHRGRCVRALVISAGTPGGAYHAAVLRSSLEGEVPHVARSAFSRWFDAPLERCMTALAARALAYARAPPVDLAGPLGGVQDWSSVDATTVTVRDARREECPGRGDYAAIKGHTVLSVGGGAPVRSQCRPARAHDRRHRQIDASWRGYGRLADHASARLARLPASEAPGVRCVIRRQEPWTPQVDSSARGHITPECCPGTDRDARRADDTLVLAGRAIAADGPSGRGGHALPLRLVGLPPPQGSGCFLTHRPPRVGPRQVAALSRVRWEVERSLRLEQSVTRLDAIAAERPCAVKPRWHAARIASTIAARLAPTPQVHTRPPQVGTPRPEAPLPPDAWPCRWRSPASRWPRPLS
jgi:hypothetical protein